MKPAAEVHVDVDLVRALLERQHPDLASEPLVPAGEGWDNVIFRAGEAFAVRLPRRAAAVPLLLKEQRWLPVLAPALGIETPVAVAAGSPSAEFPWPWSVVPWIPGESAEAASLGRDAARTLADVLRRLHLPASADAPLNPVRGVPLRERREVVEARLSDLGSPSLDRAWSQALRAPTAERHVWVHGDLHPRNVVVRGRRIVGLIDWGDLCGGDPATDLAAAWTLFEEPARDAFFQRYRAADDERVRALGWAAVFASSLLTSSEARHERIGAQIAVRVAREA